MDHFVQWLGARFSAAERGASMVEYILLVALIAIAVMAAVTFFGGEMNTEFGDSGSRLSSAGG
jgi:Flp pilus assembly pilin Flp